MKRKKRRRNDSLMGALFLSICAAILCGLFVVSKLLLDYHNTDGDDTKSRVSIFKNRKQTEDDAYSEDRLMDSDDPFGDEHYDADGNYIFEYNDAYAWIFPGMDLETKKNTSFPTEQIADFMATYVNHENSPAAPLTGRVFDNSVLPYDGAERSISCWGDSMTEGNGSYIATIVKDGVAQDISYITYPMLLEQLTGIKTYNLGVGGETSKDIAMRQGGLPMVTDRDVTIPENGAEMLNVISPDDGEVVNFNDYSGYGFTDESVINKVYIDGHLYKLTYNGESHMLFKHLRHRNKEERESEQQAALAPTTAVAARPEAVMVPAGTRVYTKAAVDRKDDILIIEMGSNGGWDENLATLVAQYDAMIQSAGCQYYIIIGDTDDPVYAAGLGETPWEATLHEAFGDHFINMRQYLIENGLQDCGLETTFADMEGYCSGEISKQLRADWTHLNAYGYYSKGLAIYQKGIELGYWN